MSCDTQTESPLALFGPGTVHVRLVRNSEGKCVTPPQIVKVPEVQSFSGDFGKADAKMLHGSKQFPLYAAQGKASSELSFECAEMTAQALNNMYLGQTFSLGGTAIYNDKTGAALADTATFRGPVQNVVTLSLGNHVANTSVTIKQGATHTAATARPVGSTLASGQYIYSNHVYEFAADDVGKEAKVTWVALDKSTGAGSTGTTVVSTFTIPAKKVIKFNIFSPRNFAISGTGLTKVAYSATATPAANTYSLQDNGTLIFNSAQAAGSLSARTITSYNDSVKFSSVIATLPAAGVVAIVNPPLTASFVTDAGVTLASGTMGALAVGDPLVKNAAPASSQYNNDVKGVYTFAAADAGASVNITFIPDYQSVTVTSPDGDIIADWGVTDQNGLPLTRVELTQPVSLANDQYATDDAGTYFFDATNRLDTMFIDFEYETTKGATVSVKNLDMGSTPLMELTYQVTYAGQIFTYKFAAVMPKDGNFSTKLDDFGTFKFSFMALADRAGGKVADVSFTPVN